MAEETINAPDNGSDSAGVPSFQIEVDWQSSAKGVSLRHANQVMAQIHEREMLLSFFVTAPPIIVGTPEQIVKQLAELKPLVPECVARITLAPHTFKSMIKIMQDKLKEYEEAVSQSGQ